jgi:hypothetical protein
MDSTATNGQQILQNVRVAQQFFFGVTMIALNEKSKATKYNNHRPIGLIAHTAKRADRILKRRTERKIEEVLAEDQFGFRRGKGIGDAVGMLIIISEVTLEMDVELWACCIGI